jgi:hypothetical protein
MASASKIRVIVWGERWIPWLTWWAMTWDQLNLLEAVMPRWFKDGQPGAFFRVVHRGLICPSRN